MRAPRLAAARLQWTLRTRGVTRTQRALLDVVSNLSSYDPERIDPVHDA
jgi:hypothetical protein